MLSDYPEHPPMVSGELRNGSTMCMMTVDGLASIPRGGPPADSAHMVGDGLDGGFDSLDIGRRFHVHPGAGMSKDQRFEAVDGRVELPVPAALAARKSLVMAPLPGLSAPFSLTNVMVIP